MPRDQFRDQGQRSAPQRSSGRTVSQEGDRRTLPPPRPSPRRRGMSDKTYPESGYGIRRDPDDMLKWQILENTAPDAKVLKTGLMSGRVAREEARAMLEEREQ